MPASFAAAVVDGEDYLAPRFREMFTGGHVGYDVENCRMIIVSHLKPGRWATYVWDFLKRAIIVLDPYMQHSLVGQLEWEHDDTMHYLHTALFDCIDAFFDGWNVSRHNWS